MRYFYYITSGNGRRFVRLGRYNSKVELIDSLPEGDKLLFITEVQDEEYERCLIAFDNMERRLVAAKVPCVMSDMDELIEALEESKKNIIYHQKILLDRIISGMNEIINKL